MTGTLTLSSACRIGLGIWVTVEDDDFLDLLLASAAKNTYSMPLYFCLSYFFVDFLSIGVLLLNFGFTVANKKQVLGSSSGRKQT